MIVLESLEHLPAVSKTVSGLTVAAKNVFDLVCYHILYCGSCRLKILPGVEMLGMFIEVFADRRCHCESKIRVYIYFADSHGGSLAQLILGNSDGAGHVAAVFIYHLDKFLRNGG